MLRVDDVGGLAVAFNVVDEQRIQAELDKLDRSLFLDKEIAPNGPRGAYVYYIVKEWLGDQAPPVPVVSWKDPDGPRPLTMALVEQVKRQEKRDEKLLERVHAANAELEQRAQDESDEHYDGIVRDFERAARSGGHFSGPVPRSRRLYLSRARGRARGR